MKYPKKKKAFARPRCRNMILTNQPRLYFTSTEGADGKEGMYLSDILLFRDIKLKIRQDVLVIICPISQFTYQLRTDDAKTWYDKISEAIMEKEIEETSIF